ncbi:hypothetical protein AcW1_000803 [Taiwanofungus camphoratus]|nr:hypothetical protein AcW2_000695 [Antrodia cinnamomea]KAI0936612.1 hypothetical protein AcV5_004703 [Antrodia cinnamomea]KAI0961828.1 hypothetical protein AcV7_000823 [Antrodia cinnamomea]KAI0963838.1 hypothetical protein AcW1_000803 [Antrodia cinnamomea]
MHEEDLSQSNTEMDVLSSPSHSVHSRAKSRSRSRLRMKSRQDYTIGICLLLAVVMLWTAGNFLTQGLFEDGYEKPFLITYLNTSAFALYLMPFAFRKVLRRYRSGGGTQGVSSRAEYQPLATDTDVAEVLTSSISESHISSVILDDAVAADLAPLTTRQTARLAAVFCLLWFIANWSVNASLDYTSVASATILSSMSGFFTLGIGRIFRVEALTIVKFVAVVSSFGGVALVSLSDSSQPQSPGAVSYVRLRADRLTTFASKHILGDALALLSALFYALYVILLKVRIRQESRIDMQLFFGFVGLFNILFCWPIGIILHFTGVEKFELPHGSSVVLALLINMAITLSSDYIYVLAMLKTTPLVVTIGLSLTMPLAVLGDFFLAKPVKGQVVVGAAVVLCSFVLVGLEDASNGEEEDLLTGQPLHEGAAVVRLEEEAQLHQGEQIMVDAERSSG